MDKKYTRLKELVGEQFTVNKINGFKFKKWDTESRRMLVSDTYEQGFKKMYLADTDKGLLDLSQSQFGSMLESVSRGGASNVVERTFEVRSNGKSGLDIRYFINPVRKAVREPENASESKVDEVFDVEEPVDLGDIPF